MLAFRAAPMPRLPPSCRSWQREAVCAKRAHRRTYERGKRKRVEKRVRGMRVVKPRVAEEECGVASR